MKHGVEDLCVLVSEDLHVRLNFHIISCQSVNSVLQRFDSIGRLLLVFHESIDLHLHPVEVMHELCYTI